MKKKMQLVCFTYMLVVTHFILYSVGSRRVRTRCGDYDGCNSSDCGSCKYCRDKKKYGGPGRLKKACLRRVCMNMSMNDLSQPAARARTPKSCEIHFQRLHMLLVYLYAYI